VHNPTDAERWRGGITLPATTDHDYELRSRGPATLSTNALDMTLDGVALGPWTFNQAVSRKEPLHENSISSSARNQRK
jgi:hypothetical protein